MFLTSRILRARVARIDYFMFWRESAAASRSVDQRTIKARAMANSLVLKSQDSQRLVYLCVNGLVQVK